MRWWVTEFKAIDPKDNELKTYGGENVFALTHKLAQEWCYKHRGHLRVLGELICEIPCKEDETEPDWSEVVDYDNYKWN